MNWYNGFSPKERGKKLNKSYKVYPNRTHPYYQGPCQICGNPDCPVEPHTEDYAEPFLWENPAEYAVCKTCHGRLHKRFNQPFKWAAYKAHVRRGGFGADTKVGKIANEIRRLAEAYSRGESFNLPPLPRTKTLTGLEWWEKLSVDPGSLTDPGTRPRR